MNTMINNNALQKPQNSSSGKHYYVKYYCSRTGDYETLSREPQHFRKLEKIDTNIPENKIFDLYRENIEKGRYNLTSSDMKFILDTVDNTMNAMLHIKMRLYRDISLLILKYDAKVSLTYITEYPQAGTM